MGVVTQCTIQQVNNKQSYLRVLSACVKIGQLQTSSNQQAIIIPSQGEHICVKSFVKASTVAEICTLYLSTLNQLVYTYPSY